MLFMSCNEKALSTDYKEKHSADWLNNGALSEGPMKILYIGPATML